MVELLQAVRDLREDLEDVNSDNEDLMEAIFSTITELDELESEADFLCESIFDCEDSYLFFKVCELYVQFTNILNETDWDYEQIVLNADW